MPKFYKNGFEEFDEELAKKNSRMHFLPASHIVLLQRGAPVFEDIGGVVAYCDFYFDPKSMKANRFLACKMGRTGRMGNPECML